MLAGMASTMAQGFAFGTGSSIAHRFARRLPSIVCGWFLSPTLLLVKCLFHVNCQ